MPFHQPYANQGYIPMPNFKWFMRQEQPPMSTPDYSVLKLTPDYELLKLIQKQLALRDVLWQQNHHGGWEPSEKLFGLLGLSGEKRKQCEKWKWKYFSAYHYTLKPIPDTEVSMTALVIAWFRSTHSTQQDVWAPAAMNAQKMFASRSYGEKVICDATSLFL